jgi:voltage-gated sodium channel
MGLIVLNAGVIFLHGFFPFDSKVAYTLDAADNFLTLVFLLEALVKIRHFSFAGYFKDGWNVFDFVLVVVALPSLLVFLTSLDFLRLDFLLTFRILRVFKVFRVLKFVPNVENLLLGIYRALRASVFIVFAFFVFNFIFAILSFSFFGHLVPEHFGNPLLAFYSTFKIFTVEGWYELPDLIAERTDSLYIDIFARIYFVLLLFGGGIFGLSLINSIFVESMMSDNNDEVQDKLDRLEAKVDQLLTKEENSPDKSFSTCSF